MPLDQIEGPCGSVSCDNLTHYYKEIFIPYSEGVFISTNHPRRKGKVGHLRLCHEHYETDSKGRYEIVIIGLSGAEDLDL